jgi:hypothetical protein
MIIGTIIEVAASASAPGAATYNGASSQHFYSEADAVTWARLQSGPIYVEGVGIRCVCCVTNTDSEVIRWWYNGTERTG